MGAAPGVPVGRATDGGCITVSVGARFSGDRRAWPLGPGWRLVSEMQLEAVPCSRWQSGAAGQLVSRQLVALVAGCREARTARRAGRLGCRPPPSDTV